MALFSIPVKAPPQPASNANTDRPIRHLNQIELSRRWCISPRTLERWRWLKAGPRYLKIGGRVVYRLEDVEAFETAQIKDGPQKRLGELT
jgi:hypothetical protein